MVTKHRHQARAGVTKKVPFGPDDGHLRRFNMIRKTIGFNIKGYVLKVGFLIEKLPKASFLATVTCPGHYKAEPFDDVHAAIHWAQSTATWETGTDGIEREMRVVFLRNDECEVVYRAFAEPSQVVLINRVL